MNQAYKIQQDTLKLFQGETTRILSQVEIDNLNIYKGLVINSMESLLAKVFSEIYQFYKEEWREITQDYFQLFPCKSPIYSQSCKNFPEFLASAFFKKKYHSNNYFEELALFKWLDLEVYNQVEEKRLENSFIQNYKIMNTNFNIPLIINYVSSSIDLNKVDDMEIEKNYILIFRLKLKNQTLILNKMTYEFIQELEKNKDLNNIKSYFINKYNSKTENITQQVEILIKYLLKSEIIL